MIRNNFLITRVMIDGKIHISLHDSRLMYISDWANRQSRLFLSIENSALEYKVFWMLDL
jgi:hypothetical protein